MGSAGQSKNLLISSWHEREREREREREGEREREIERD
jgi:hypothetical protein